MAENSAIEWTDHTFNAWMGCTKVHAGCANCYAETLMDKRWGKVQWGPTGNRIVASEAMWKQPLKWNRDAEQAGKRARVFCASLADVFEDWRGPMLNAKGKRLYSYVDVNASAIDGSSGLTMSDCRARLFALIDATPWLDWILVTKRPQNVRQMWPTPAAYKMLSKHYGPAGFDPTGSQPERQRFRENVWLLTSVSDQATADKQIPELLKCRHLSPVLGISAEPLLGPLSFRWAKWAPLLDANHLDGLRMLDWVIVGGESGHHARPMHPEWARTIRDECVEAGVPFFFKQWGEYASVSEVEGAGAHFHFPDGATVRRVGKKKAGRSLNGRVYSELPGVA